MDKRAYEIIERHMLSLSQGGVHDREHVYRVLYTALTIAQAYPAADRDVLIAACLLHDIGRSAQATDPDVCHARVGAALARAFLVDAFHAPGFADKVALCVAAHRYRGGVAPASLEAQILYDADKLDATGALGIARTIAFGGEEGEPLYAMGPDGVSDGANDLVPSFFQEYKFKLEGLYDKFYTPQAAALAALRRDAAQAFYKAMLAEAQAVYRQGRPLLDAALGEG